MPKYDAFGREIGEDTLSGLGGEPGATPEPVVSPSPAEGWGEQPAQEAPRSASTDVPIAPPAQPEPASFTIPGHATAAGRPHVRRRAGGLGCLLALVVLAVVVAGPIVALVSFVDEAGNTITDVRESFQDPARDGPGATPGGQDGPPPEGIGGRSMIRTANLAGAMAELRRQDLGKLGRLTVWPDRVNGELITKRDNERNVVIVHDGEIREGDPVDVGIPQDTIAWNAIDPAAPARLVRASARRFKVEPRQIDYLIASPPDAFSSGPVQWVAYFKNLVYVEGDAKGRVVRRIG